MELVPHDTVFGRPALRPLRRSTRRALPARQRVPIARQYARCGSGPAEAGRMRESTFGELAPASRAVSAAAPRGCRRNRPGRREVCRRHRRAPRCANPPPRPPLPACRRPARPSRTSRCDWAPRPRWHCGTSRPAGAVPRAVRSNDAVPSPRATSRASASAAARTADHGDDEPAAWRPDDIRTTPRSNTSSTFSGSMRPDEGAAPCASGATPESASGRPTPRRGGTPRDPHPGPARIEVRPGVSIVARSELVALIAGAGDPHPPRRPPVPRRSPGARLQGVAFGERGVLDLGERVRGEDVHAQRWAVQPT